MPAEELFAGASEVIIEHQGEEYRLQKILLAHMGPNGPASDPRPWRSEREGHAVTDLFFLGTKQCDGASPPALMLTDSASQRVLV